MELNKNNIDRSKQIMSSPDKFETFESFGNDFHFIPHFLLSVLEKIHCNHHITKNKQTAEL